VGKQSVEREVKFDMLNKATVMDRIGEQLFIALGFGGENHKQLAEKFYQEHGEEIQKELMRLQNYKRAKTFMDVALKSAINKVIGDTILKE